MKVKALLTKAVTKAGVAALTVGAFTTTAFAQFSSGEVAPLAPVKMTTTNFIDTVVKYALAFVGVLAVLYLIYGGVTYITAGGDAEKAGKGRTAITNAIIGIIIILAALVIYNAVVSAPTSGGSL